MSETSRIGPRTLETLGLLMIGDGLMAAAHPESHARLWHAGPRPWRKTMDPFVDHPRWTRWLGVAEAAVGYWLARRAQAG